MLEPSNFYVAADIETAESLPAQSFGDKAVLERERTTVFSESWLLLPEPSSAEEIHGPRTLRDQLQKPGSYCPVEVNGRPVYLHRGDDNRLRAFPNVCTHAWYPLVRSAGQGRALTCAQHGRRFDCKGQFLSQPGFSKLANFPRACDHLKPFALAQWHDLFFLCTGQARHDFAKIFEPIDATVSKLMCEPLRRVYHAAETRRVPGNWKQHAWNFMDKFHIPFIHRGPKGLVDLLDYPKYRTELHPHAALQWAWAKNPEHGFDPELLPARFHDPAGRRILALWWFIYPNLTLNFYPWGLSVNRYEPAPNNPRETCFYWYHYVRDEALYARVDEIWQNHRVDAEDVEAMALVQQGIESGWAQRGRFAPAEEIGPHWFHRTTYEHLFGSWRQQG